MTTLNPYEQLGISEGASFEEVQVAKQRLTQTHKDDQKLVQRIESAYDSIIMERLRLRQEGKIKVPDRIRFPERAPVEVSKSVPNVVSTPPNWLQGFLDTPTRNDLLYPTGIFVGLALLTLLNQDIEESTVSLLVALGFGAALFFLNRKEKRFGRSLLLTLSGLIASVALTSGLLSLLGANAGLSLSETQFVALVAFVVFWLESCFLR
ncbi:MAG: CPP1-like family protein [Cyanobacteria bacterium P01_H01_bin.15]